MSRARVSFGKHGEDLACAELERRGYAIIARRYRRRGGEIDIIARHGATVVFVEVKTREGSEYGEPSESLTAIKRRRIGQIAVDYLARQRLLDCPSRFDVVSVVFNGDRAAIEVFQNAFETKG